MKRPKPNRESNSGLFYANRQLLSPGLVAPVPLDANPKQVLQGILRQLFVHHHVNGVLVEPAAVTGGSVLFGCQEFILGCNELLEASSSDEVVKCSQRILFSCREVSGTMDSIYALMQVADELAAKEPRAEAPASPSNRLKNLAVPLEDFFAAADFTSGMELERKAQLQVHLDEVYDEACRHLERFYFAITQSPAVAPFTHFARSLYRDTIQRLLPHHILTESHEGDEEDGRRGGLLELLPELEESLR